MCYCVIVLMCEFLNVLLCYCVIVLVDLRIDELTNSKRVSNFQFSIFNFQFDCVNYCLNA